MYMVFVTYTYRPNECVAVVPTLETARQVCSYMEGDNYLHGVYSIVDLCHFEDKAHYYEIGYDLYTALTGLDPNEIFPYELCER